MIGVASGGYTVWKSKFGAANDAANVASTTGDAGVADQASSDTASPTAPIPLDFKESD